MDKAVKEKYAGCLLDRQYINFLESYRIKDGMKAVSVYVISMGFLVLQGMLLKTDLSTAVLTGTQIFFPALDILLCAVVLKLSGESCTSVGITRRNLKKSICAGVAGAIPLIALASVASGGFSSQKLTWITFCIFVVGAVSEEILFRGYLQTRLHGLTRNPLIESLITAILFVAVHYPVRWVSSGQLSLTVLSEFYIVLLLLLHFACDLVYKRTGCLWGAIVLHFLYNFMG